jgi:hypothetical protein
VGIAVVPLLMSTYSTNLVWEQKSEPVLHEDMLALELVAEGLGSPQACASLTMAPS